MKICVVRKDGRSFNVQGELAERILEVYKSRKDVPLELEGNHFSAREIKEIIEKEKQTDSVVKSCGKCRDGMQLAITDENEYAIPCDCSLGAKYQELVKYKKGIPPLSIKETINPTSHNVQLQQFKDRDKEYSEIEQELLDMLKKWTKVFSKEERSNLSDAYKEGCKLLKSRGLDLEKQYYQ